jgi:glutamate mutase epsilon subunit
MNVRIVSPEEAAAIRAAADGPIPRSENGGALRILLDGGMVHFPDEVQHFNRKALRERHRVKLRKLSDGEGGCYYWADPIQDPP